MTATVVRLRRVTAPGYSIDGRNWSGWGALGMDPRGHVDAHLDWLRQRNLSPATIAQRRRTLARLEAHAHVPAHEATTAHLRAFRDRLTVLGAPLAPNTQAAELAHLTGFYRWLVTEGIREDDPTIRVPRPKVPRGLPRPISEPDLRRAIRTAPDRVRPWLMLAAFAGLRACEVAPLRHEDLLWDHDPPVIHVRHGKGGDARMVPMAPTLAQELRRLPRRGPWCFERHDGRPGPVAPWLVSQLANRHLHSQGIWDTFHSLRHRFGTQVLRASGRDLRATQELLGHRSIVSTAIYTAVDQGEAAGIVAALPLAV